MCQQPGRAGKERHGLDLGGRPAEVEHYGGDRHGNVHRERLNCCCGELSANLTALEAQVRSDAPELL